MTFTENIYNMKRILYLLIPAIMGTACSSADDISLTFNVTSPTSGSVVVVCHNDIHEIPLDSLGNGVCELSGMDAVYLKVFYGMDRKLVYAENGDAATISFDGNDFNGTFMFEGKKASAVKYLNSIVLTALPDEDYGLPFDEFSARILSKTEEASELLHTNNLKGTGNFKAMEEARIRYSYAIQLLMYPMAHMMMTGNPDYRPDETYYEAIRNCCTENPMYAGIDEYLEFMAESAHVLDAANRNVNELYPKLLAEMKYISKNYSDSKVRQALLHHIAVPYIDNFGTDGTEDMANIYRTYVDNPAYLADFNAKCDKWDRKKPGKPSADFEATSLDGKVYTLADFRGKYLYIDIWATWCQPCMREVPHMKELEKKFEGRNITFLGLSTDKEKTKWEEKVRSGEMPGIQLYLGNENDFLEAYGVRGIPRFILLDKEGKIINPEMTRPSSDDTEKFLSNLKGI